MCACGVGCPARSAWELVAAISRSAVVRVFLPAVLGYWGVVGGGLFLPPFFLLLPSGWVDGMVPVVDDGGDEGE